MILHNQTLVDRILSALRELREAESEMLGLLEELLSENQNDYEYGAGTGVDAGSGQWTYTGQTGEGDDLPRDGISNEPVRYNRGTKASDEWPLRQQRDT